MQLLYLVSGTTIQNHFQAHFSILTFLRQGLGELTITVMADAPEFYRHLGAAVAAQVIGAETLRPGAGICKPYTCEITRRIRFSHPAQQAAGAQHAVAPRKPDAPPVATP